MKKVSSTNDGMADGTSRGSPGRHGLTEWPRRILPGALILAGMVMLRSLGWLQGLEWKALDFALRMRPAEPLDDRILVIGIDEADIQHIGAYPVPDRHLAELLQTLEAHEPRVIGLDIYRDLPVEPGHSELTAVFQSLEQVIAIEKLLPPPVAGPATLPDEQIGFADVVVDGDGFVRRSLLGAVDSAGDFHFAFSLQVAEAYLAQAGLSLENGIRDPVAMRFGETELSPLSPNAGGYVQADMGGHQVLVNYRSGPTPFRTLTWSQIQAGEFEPQWLRDRIVLIGITAPSVKDFVNTAAISTENPGLVFGIEYQAHAVSQIVSAALDDRPLLRPWSEGWEYTWIIVWGAIGILLGCLCRKPLPQTVSVIGGCAVMLALSYGSLLWLGWWIPVVPTVILLLTNGMVFPLFYWYDRELRSRIQERQLVIDTAFSAIHNGPLQTLACLLQDTYRNTESPATFYDRLQTLNQELREVYGLVRQEALVEETAFHLNPHHRIDLQIPLHQSLYEVFTQTLQQPLPTFASLKVKLIEFEPMDARTLTLEDKRDLCRFLQEILQNVGKHAHGVTRLRVTCKQTGHENLIRVADNGIGLGTANAASPSPSPGQGTQQAQRLSKRLQGHFRRYPNQPKGTVCELIWPVSPRSRRSFWPF